jgi:hydrogenase maturation protein HypF
MGRLFDAVASLLGLVEEVTHEGEAAIHLEAVAREVGSAPGSGPGRYAFELREPEVGGAWRIDPAPVLRGLVDDLEAGAPVGVMAAGFHRAVAEATAEVCRRVLESPVAEGGPRRVGITGGVFQNRLLTRLTVEELEARGVDALLHRVVPPNDGGLSVGQAMIGAALRSRRGATEGAAG